jgi:hypothetical protein
MSIHARLLRFFPAIGGAEIIARRGDFASRAHASAWQIDAPPS